MSDNEEEHQVRTFVISWDSHGVEAIIDVTQKSEECFFDMIKGKNEFNKWLNHTLTALTLRAKFNHQRFYEIYSINCDYSMSDEQMREWFEATPQEAADMVRSRGHKIYSDRQSPGQIKIR